MPTIAPVLDAGLIVGGSALTKVDDTNVTLTLGGIPASALLTPVSLTLGWTGQLGLARGGTNADLSATGGASQVLRQSSVGAAITVSQLAFTDISGTVTDAQVPNTITLDNITQITTRLHSSLQTLTADDHPNNAYLLGRSGGQIYTAGTGAGEDLILRSTTNATKGSIILGDDITTDESVVIHGTESGITIGGVAFHSHLSVHDQASVGDALYLGHHHTNTGAVGPTVLYARSRGTEASETVVADNDILARLLAVGFDGTDYERAAQIVMEVDDATPSGTSMGGAIVLSTTATGATTVTERLRIAQDGRVTVAGSGLGINGLPYVWPGSQAANRVLKTNGSSTLSWGQVDFTEVTGTVTDAQVPNTITLDNITQITTRLHSSLQSLTADDHTQYTLRAGRTGTTNDTTLSSSAGGTLYGSSVTGNNLTLRANSVSSGQGAINFEQPGTWTGAAFPFASFLNLIELLPSGITIAGGIPIYHLINFGGTMTIGSNIATVTAFADNGIMQPDSAARTNMGTGYGFGGERQFINNTAGNPSSQYFGYFLNPIYTNTGGGTITGGLVGNYLRGSIGSGTTINDYTGFWLQGATINGAITTARGLRVSEIRQTGTGTVTDVIGVDLEDQTVASGLKLSLRSAGADVNMRHAGRGVFGANAAPTNTSVGLEVQSTTRAFLLPRMTTTQRNAMTPVNGMMIYNTVTGVIEGYEAGAWVNL